MINLAAQNIKVLDTNINLTTILICMVSVLLFLFIVYLFAIRIFGFTRKHDSEESRFIKTKHDLKFNQLINDIDLEIIKAMDSFKNIKTEGDKHVTQEKKE